MRHITECLGLAAAVMGLVSGTALAAPTFSFTTLGNPPFGGRNPEAQGINDAGQIVGSFFATLPSKLGFELTGSTYSTFMLVTGDTQPNGINNLGEIVGGFIVSPPLPGDGFPGGFSLNGPTGTTFFNVPVVTIFGVPTAAYGVNDAGQIVGEYDTLNISGTSSGFLMVGSTYTTINVPGAIDTAAFGINNSGQIVGDYTTGSNQFGFLLTGSTYTTINFPGATNTQAFGINNSEQIVGAYVDTSGNTHGFLLTGATYTELDVPFTGATNTEVNGINDAEQIVGNYQDASGTEHGFLATPVTAIPEPASVVMVATAGLFGLGPKQA